MTETPYKVLILDREGNMISGDRDALVELRSAINEALAHGVAHLDASDGEGWEMVVTVERLGS
jgi:hypothetical protein